MSERLSGTPAAAVLGAPVRTHLRFGPAGWSVLLVLALLALPAVLQGFWVYSLGICFANAIAVLSVTVLIRYSGEVSIGHSVFVAAGAYTVGILDKQFGISALVSLPLVVAAGVVLGVGFAFPSRRLSGIYLAVTTMAMALALPELIIQAGPVAGGFEGLYVSHEIVPGVPKALQQYYFALLLLIAAVGALARLRASRQGLAMLTARSHPAAAEAFGVGRDWARLIGPNGAGKTSFFNCLTGLYRPQKGSIHFGEDCFDGLPPAARARQGLARSFQHVALSPDLTALENVMFGLVRTGRSGWLSAFLPLPQARAEVAAMRSKAATALARLGIADAADVLPSELPPGTLRLVEIARAIVATPRILLLDEPAAGLNAAETRELTRVLRQLVAPGLVIVVVEHDMDLIMEICNRIYVLNFGDVIACGTPDEVRRDPEVARIYLGAEDD